MPRIWKARYGVSPFADLLVQRMTAHAPPLQPHHVAAYLGVDQAVVSNWLNRGSIPGAPVCSLLAAFFHDAPDVWYRAAGRQTPQTRADSAPFESLQSLYAELIALSTEMAWPQEKKTLVIQSLREMQEMSATASNEGIDGKPWTPGMPGGDGLTWEQVQERIAQLASVAHELEAQIVQLAWPRLFSTRQPLLNAAHTAHVLAGELESVSRMRQEQRERLQRMAGLAELEYTNPQGPKPEYSVTYKDPDGLTTTIESDIPVTVREEQPKLPWWVNDAWWRSSGPVTVSVTTVEPPFRTGQWVRLKPEWHEINHALTTIGEHANLDRGQIVELRPAWGREREYVMVLWDGALEEMAYRYAELEPLVEEGKRDDNAAAE